MEHFETLLRCLAHLSTIIANAPKALEAISKGWNAFRRFLEGLDGYGMGMDTPITPSTGTLCVNVSDTIPVGDGPDVIVQLTGGTIRASGGRLFGTLS